MVHIHTLLPLFVLHILAMGCPLAIALHIEIKEQQHQSKRKASIDEPNVSVFWPCGGHEKGSQQDEQEQLRDLQLREIALPPNPVAQRGEKVVAVHPHMDKGIQPGRWVGFLFNHPPKKNISM